MPARPSQAGDLALTNHTASDQTQSRLPMKLSSGRRRLQMLTTLLRCAEAIAAAVLILRLSAHIPSAARSSGELLLRLLRVILGPSFLFLLGNAIVLTLLFRSRRLSKERAADEIPISISAFLPPPATEAVFEEKRVCCAEPPHVRRACRRSVSQRATEDQPRRLRSTELRRSETDVGNLEEEEFRRTIEAFIEKQWRFLQREESLAIVRTSDTGLD